MLGILLSGVPSWSCPHPPQMNARLTRDEWNGGTRGRFEYAAKPVGFCHEHQIAALCKSEPGEGL